ncbi:MAG: prenyltransferase/squalene oxidase repeat-containing protein [Planctomycetota bacterium]
MKKAMVLTAVAMLLLIPVLARADTESPALAKYRGRVDLAVKKALAFIAARQRPDGSFHHNESDGAHRTNAIAGLAGMAYLSVGHTPGRGPYGDVINRCIDFVLATPMGKHVLYVPGRSVEGYLVRANHVGRMYSHAIATLFLCEVSGMVDPERQKKIDAILPHALKIILTAQAIQKRDPRHAGGWRYLRTSNTSDLSISGWCLMALRSARLNGAPVPAEAIQKATEYVNRCHDSSTGGFAYQPQPGEGKVTPAMSAVGLLCRELSGHHDDAINRRCGDYLLGLAQEGKLFAGDPTYSAYTIYYASNAMFQLGGTHWERFAPLLYKHLLNWQGTDGSVVLGHYGKVYSTSMYVLSLTPSYCQLPIYQR